MTWTMTMWTKQMMNPIDPDKQRGTDSKRGIDYADGGVSDLNVYYPNPKAVRKCNDEWADLAEWNTDCVPPAEKVQACHDEWHSEEH